MFEANRHEHNNQIFGVGAGTDTGLTVIGYVMGIEGHEYYANAIFPAVTSTALHIVAFVVIACATVMVVRFGGFSVI